MSIELENLQRRCYIRLLNTSVTVKAGGKESVVFPVSKNVPSDILNIISSSFSLYDANNVLTATGTGGALGPLIANFQINATSLAVGTYKFVGDVVMSNGDILRESLEVNVVNA